VGSGRGSGPGRRARTRAGQPMRIVRGAAIDRMMNLRGLSKWKLAIMAGCAASVVGAVCVIAALIFGLMLADKNHKLASTSTARAKTALAVAQTETARPTETPSPKATAAPATVVAVPTSTPSLTPQPTTPATFTPLVPTATLTPSPTPSPTSTSRPTSTPRPATRTPTPSASPTALPTASLPPPAPPVLGEPVDFAGIWGLETFTWTPAGPLAADQYYVVHVRIFGDVRTEAHALGIPSKDPSLTVDVELRARDHVWNHWVDGGLEHGHEAWWSVAIVRCPNGPSAQYQVLTETYLRSFTFMGFSHKTQKECGCNEHVCDTCRCHEECCQVCCKRCGQP
jgi:hypothetical protein